MFGKQVNGLRCKSLTTSRPLNHILPLVFFKQIEWKSSLGASFILKNKKIIEVGLNQESLIHASVTCLFTVR